jgi:hypothetical protein
VQVHIEMTDDVSRSYRWSIVDLWEEYIFRIFVEDWFSNLLGCCRTRLSSYFGDIFTSCEDDPVLRFGDIVLVGRDGFSLGIYEIYKVIRIQIFFLICVDDSSPIFCVSVACNFCQ